jgi:hypothetical protein
MKSVPQPNVLFVNIGWASKYDGRHQIQGNHADIKNQGGNPSTLSEGKAFLPGSTGFVYCGAGDGRVTPDSSIDVVFVARNPRLRNHEIVGIYFEPSFSYKPWTNAKGNVVTWADAYTKHFIELLDNQRPGIAWPPGRSMRRWVRRRSTIRYSALFNQYVALIGSLYSTILDSVEQS